MVGPGRWLRARPRPVSPCGSAAVGVDAAVHGDGYASLLGCDDDGGRRGGARGRDVGKSRTRWGGSGTSVKEPRWSVAPSIQATVDVMLGIGFLRSVVIAMVTDLVTNSPKLGEKHATQWNPSEIRTPDKLHV